MTTASKRQEIADALNDSGLVKADPYIEGSKAGSAWIRLGTSSREEGLFEDSWRVFIVLPQSEVSADKWRDANQDALQVALQDTGYVESFEPVILGPENDPLFGLQINFRSD